MGAKITDEAKANLKARRSNAVQMQQRRGSCSAEADVTSAAQSRVAYADKSYNNIEASGRQCNTTTTWEISA